MTKQEFEHYVDRYFAGWIDNKTMLNIIDQYNSDNNIKPTNVNVYKNIFFKYDIVNGTLQLIDKKA